MIVYTHGKWGNLYYAVGEAAVNYLVVTKLYTYEAHYFYNMSAGYFFGGSPYGTALSHYLIPIEMAI